MKHVDDNWTSSKVYFFDTPHRRDFCAKHGLQFPEDGWIDQGVVSQALLVHEDWIPLYGVPNHMAFLHGRQSLRMYTRHFTMRRPRLWWMVWSMRVLRGTIRA